MKIRWQLLLLVVGLGSLLTVYAVGRRAEQAVQTAAGQTAADSPRPIFSIGESAEQTDVAACTADGYVRGGLAVQGVVGRPMQLNPLLADGNPVDEQLTALIFDGLTRVDATGRVQPALASSWEIGEDRQTVLFTLGEEARWHDGTPVSAADVVFTYQLLQDPLINEQLPDGPVWQNLTVEAVGDRQVRVTLAAPYSPFLLAAARGILPAHLLADVTAADLLDHPFNQQPVGSGPFRVANNWSQDGYLLLRPRAAAVLNGLQIRFYPSDEALLADFQAGTIQLTASMAAERVPAFLQVPQSSIYTGYAPILTQLMFNVSDSGSPVTRDQGVRQAIAQTIDRRALLTAAAAGQGVPLIGPFLIDSWVNIRQDGVNQPLAERLSQGQETLTAAGWVTPTGGNEGDGASAAAVRQLGDNLLTMTILVIDQPHQVAVAESLAEQLSQLDGRFEIEAVPAAEFYQRLRERNYEAAVVDVEITAGPDLYDLWSQEAIVRGQNIAGWNHRRASEALEAARQTWGEEERRQFYQAFWQFFAADQPAVTLYQQMAHLAIRDTIEGVDAGPLYHTRDQLASFTRWTLPENRAAEVCQDE